MNKLHNHFMKAHTLSGRCDILDEDSSVHKFVDNACSTFPCYGGQ